MKKLFFKLDIPLLLMTILYCILGLVLILSASSVSAVLRYKVSSYHFFIRQLIFVFFSFIIGFYIVLKIPTKNYKIFTPVLVIGMLAALVGLFFYGIISNHAQSWYDLGFFHLQPAEFAKSVLILYMAVFYHRSLKKKKVNLYYNLIPLGVAGIFFVLVAMQPDLGGALIIGGIAFLIFLTVPLGKQNQFRLFKVLAIGAIVLVVALLYSGTDILNSRQLSRLQFQNPCSRYIEETGYQVCNGFIAIHNGGLFGVGLGNSTQKYLYLPEAYTDFIFPIIIEELGVIGGAGIMILYLILLYRILVIARNATSLVCSIIAFGTFAQIITHIAINLGGALALMPLTGVPLPFLSYGGSYILNLVILLSLTQRVAIESKEDRARKKQKKVVGG